MGARVAHAIVFLASPLARFITGAGLASAAPSGGSSRASDGAADRLDGTVWRENGSCTMVR
jgi:hypothetical protein